MEMKNKYKFRGRSRTEKFRQILMYFCEAETATKTSKYTGISRNTIYKTFDKFRQRIAEISVANAPEFGEFEVDESYF